MRGSWLTPIAVVLLIVDLATRLPVAAHSQSAPLARFAGTWQAHGAILILGPRGRGYYQARTYVDCTNRILTDCDRSKGGFIYDGGFGALTVSRVVGNTVSATITSSSTSWEINTKISFTLTRNDILIARGASDLLDQRRFCGPRAPVGACGA
ncbi:MAG: hypothetical protein PVSMB7_10440 [Chloroflexota bacterium]